MITTEIENKAAELSKSIGRKVTPIVFIEGEETIVGYIKEPERVVKQRAFDKALVSQSQAGAELLEYCLLKEHSDSRIYSDKSEHDHIYLGACVAALDVVKIAVEQSGKKK
jgi:hypothetical protein